MNTQPFTNSKGVISGNCWRIGILSDSLLRLEWSDTGEFNDDATLMAVNRDFGTPPEYSTSIADGLLTVETTALRLTYDMRPFSKEGLSIVVKGVKDTKTNTWHFGDAQEGNMKGTARTLDWADGAIPLNDGVVSRDGWSVLDDSNTCLFADNGDIKPRKNAGIDLYFFGHGHRYADAVSDFCRLSGRSPLLPRYALGNWWSRFHRYTSEEYVALMDRFKSEGIPFTTSVIDMDWHLVDDVDPRFGSGWTGYTWNRKLIPDPQRFLGDLHERGCHVSLNVHPRDGIRAFEDCYPSAAKTMGIPPDSGEPVEFDLTDPRFVRAYFDMHHDLEAEGVDFWWIDWQQGGVTRQPGLDPLWALNHMHYCDSARDGRWPLILSRFAGPGSQRYPVGFSGDTIVTWESLRFQPYFTATALPRRGAGGPMVPARRVQPDQPPALHLLAVLRQGTMELPPGDPCDHGRCAPPAPSHDSVPPHHELARIPDRPSPGGAHVLGIARHRRRIPGSQRIHVRHRTAGRAHHGTDG